MEKFPTLNMGLSQPRRKPNASLHSRINRQNLASNQRKTAKKLVSECKKALHVSGKAMSSQELNAFIVLSGKKDGTVDQKVVDSVETGRVYRQFKKY